MRELVYYVAVGLDGRIAGPGGDFSAFPTEGDHMATIVSDYVDTLPTAALDALGLTPRGDRFDTVLMGWNTYAVGLTVGVDSPYRHLRQLVFSGTAGRTVGNGVELISNDAVGTVRGLKSTPGRAIWLCGGGKLAATLAAEIDRLILKVNPLVFGCGPLLFDGPMDGQEWTPSSRRSFESGVSINEYVRR